MSSIISVQLEALEALAGELTALAGELSDDADLCRGASAALCAGLSRDEGLEAGAAATAWSSLIGAVADGARAIAGALIAAVAAYRAADRARAERIARPDRGFVAVAW